MNKLGFYSTDLGIFGWKRGVLGWEMGQILGVGRGMMRYFRIRRAVMRDWDSSEILGS